MEEEKKQEFQELHIYKYKIHYAKVHHYNDGTYKWRPVIPIRRVYNAWVVIPLFTEKEKSKNMDNYFLVEELSKTENIYIDLSRQEKIFVSKDNFNKYPIRYENDKWHTLKKSTITLIQKEMNKYLFQELSLARKLEKQLVLTEKENERTNEFEKELLLE